MSFFMEYLQKKIIENMEDPKERERRWEKRLRAAKASAEEAYVCFRANFCLVHSCGYISMFAYTPPSMKSKRTWDDFVYFSVTHEQEIKNEPSHKTMGFLEKRKAECKERNEFGSCS